MITEIEKRYEENKLIKQETRITVLISLAILISVGIYTALAYFFQNRSHSQRSRKPEKGVRHD